MSSLDHQVIDMTGAFLDEKMYPFPFLPKGVSAEEAFAIVQTDGWIRDQKNTDKASKRAMNIDTSGFIYRDGSMEKDGVIPDECQLNLSGEAFEIYTNVEKVSVIVDDMLTPCAANGLLLFERQVYNTIAFSILSNMCIYESFKKLYTCHIVRENLNPHDTVKAFIAWVAWAYNNEWAWSTDPMTAKILIGLGESTEKQLQCMKNLLEKLFEKDGNLTANSLYYNFADICSDAILTDLKPAMHLTDEETNTLVLILDGIETDLDRYQKYSAVCKANMM
jgi:hypothetical protein